MSDARAAENAAMETPAELSVTAKKETGGQEKTVPGRHYVPPTDVYETSDGLTLMMEMPGVGRENLTIELEDDVLKIEGRIDFSKYQGLEPLYTEYDVGHYARSFSISDRVDRDAISAKFEEGVLTLTLPRSAAARPRKVEVG